MIDRHRVLALLLLLATPLLLAQAPPPAPAPSPSDSPVGRWVAEHPKGDALELWWDFRPDGNITATAGAIARTRYTLTGNTLTIAPTAHTPGGTFDVHFIEGRLFRTATAPHSPTLEFTRIGEPTSSANALVGAWRVSNAPHATDPDQETLRNRLMNLITVYRADGSYETRLPIETFRGQWDAAAHTYTLKDHSPLRFSRSADGLKIELPPDGKESHLYHSDTFPDP